MKLKFLILFTVIALASAKKGDRKKKGDRPAKAAKPAKGSNKDSTKGDPDQKHNGRAQCKKALGHHDTVKTAGKKQVRVSRAALYGLCKAEYDEAVSCEGRGDYCEKINNICNDEQVKA